MIPPINMMYTRDYYTLRTHYLKHDKLNALSKSNHAFDVEDSVEISDEAQSKVSNKQSFLSSKLMEA